MKVKKGIRKMRNFFRRYINGGKGAVSLLLVLVMSPLLSISLILVESARYQDANELMGELMDSASFSTLADYDSYLDERFGVLSLSQENDIQNAYKNYLSENIKTIGRSISLDSESAVGKFPLSNAEILKQQILECSEISALTEMITKVTDLEGFIEKLKGANKEIEKMDKQVKAMEKCADLTKEVGELLENISNAIKGYRPYADALNQYKNAYTDFKNKVLDLASALKNAENNLKEDESHDDIYNKSDVRAKLSAAMSARNAYRDSVVKLKEELNNMKENIGAIFDSLDAVTQKINEFKDAIDEAAGDEPSTQTTYEWIIRITNVVTTRMKEIVSDNYKDLITRETQQLDNQRDKLDAFNDRTVSSSWDGGTVDGAYGLVNLSVISNDFQMKLEDTLNLLNQEAAMGESQSKQLEGLLSIVENLMGISVFYDSSLDSAVSQDALYTSTHMKWSSQFAIGSMRDLLEACSEIQSLGAIPDIISAIKAVAKLLLAIAEFLTAVIFWATEFLIHLVDFFFRNPKEYYNDLLLYAYGVYNMPNRSNYKDGKTLSGYGYSKIFNLAGGQYRSDLGGSLESWGSFGADSSGSDKMFKGAEAEYIFIGSNSEIANQSATFFNLYLFRLFWNMFPVWTNDEVSEASRVFGPYKWVYKILINLAEPMLDSIVLVNGGKEYLIKETIYLTGSGIKPLLNDLKDVSSFPESLKGDLERVINGGSETEKKGLFELSYSEHLWMLMLFNLEQDEYVKRLQNIIQMEAACKYEDKYQFELDKAYTYIYSDVDYKLNSLFKFDELNARGIVKGSKAQYLGY